VARDSRKRSDDIRGLAKLAVDATHGVTDAVRKTHWAIGGAPARFFSTPAYAAIRGATTAVGGTLDFVLAKLAPLLGEGAATAEREVFLAALNGVVGDYLVRTNNPLAAQMRLRAAEGAVVKNKILVFVHGSSMNRQCWQGARDLGYTAVYLDYNSGLNVSTNARAFSAALDAFVAKWPVPVEEIVFVAHSMGGLVVRGACYYAEKEKRAWRAKLRSIIFLGTPHHGAPLERIGNWVETVLAGTRYSAPIGYLGRLRSAGVTDLRYGNVIDEHWQGRDRFEVGPGTRLPVPLPLGVTCYTVAAEKDGLVPLTSAMGDHREAAQNLRFPESHRFIATGLGHIDILRSPDVWDRIEQWLAA